MQLGCVALFLSIEESMTAGFKQKSPLHGRHLLWAVLLLAIAGAVLACVWQMPQLLSLLTATTPAANVTATATPTSALMPTIDGLGAQVDDRAGTITFSLNAKVPPDRQVAEALLWYDTEIGRQVRHFAGPLPPSLTLSYTLDTAREALTRTLTTTRDLDYWWLVRDSAGESARAGGTVDLGPSLQAVVVTPIPTSSPTFTWTISSTRHFQLYYAPGTAAERDRFQIGALAETSLANIVPILDVQFEGQMDVYLVPRVFWQGGAAYGDKVQLISYLDRNYTGIEIWSYFTHEGTHALAQDLLQPKAEGEGGPDGVLVEGLAVWASGGHYRQEPLDAWAAVVAASDAYLPLAGLRAGPFYDFQHETAYLEGASFVKFLIEQYGLPKFKELYGRANSDAVHDESLVELLYNKGYATLEAEWLAYLAGLDPTPEQAQTWDLKVRSFDLMRRYETELDPDARILPQTPTEWSSDTLHIFLHRASDPLNVVLETALIAAQERLYGGDAVGAAALLNDMQAALDAGGDLTRPSLQARAALLDLVAAQDRAVLRADADAYRYTLAPTSALARDAAVADRLAPPFVAYEQEMVRLDVADDGRSAQGMVLVHAQVADDQFPGDGQLWAVTFVQAAGGWRMAGRTPTEAILPLPPTSSIMPPR
jgi:hypothetical protein